MISSVAPGARHHHEEERYGGLPAGPTRTSSFTSSNDAHSNRNGRGRRGGWDDVRFVDVCKVLDRLADPFLPPRDKLQYLYRYLHKFKECLAKTSQLYSLFRIFIPQLDRRRPPSFLKQPLLARVYAQVFALPPAASARLRLYKDPSAASSVSVRAGDFGSFVASIVKQRIGKKAGVITVGELNDYLDQVATASSMPEKIATLQTFLPYLTVEEHRWCMRILMKDVKFGGLSGERLLTVLHPDARKIVNQCSDLKSTLDAIEEEKELKGTSRTVKEENDQDRNDETTAEGGALLHGPDGRQNAGLGREEEGRRKERWINKSLRPMLAQLVRPAASDIRWVLFGGDNRPDGGEEEDKREKVEGEKQEGETEGETEGRVGTRKRLKHFGSGGGQERGQGRDCVGTRSHEYFVERKYDGERLLAHIDRTSSPPSVRLFSRRGKDYTSLYGRPKQDQHANESFGGRDALSNGLSARSKRDRRYASGEDADEDDDKIKEENKEEEEGEKGGAEARAIRSLSSILSNSLRGSQAILDGELLAWDDELGTFLPFGSNKSVAVTEHAGCHLSYVVFDVLFYRNASGDSYPLFNVQLKDRKILLERILKPYRSRLMIAPYVLATRSSQVVQALNSAIRLRHEGILVKETSSFYSLNSRRGGWFKIKPHLGVLPDTLDLIVIGGFFAQGTRRRELASTHLIDHCSHFLLGVLEGEGGPNSRRVRSFCKVGTGFPLSTLKTIRDLLRPYCRRLRGEGGEEAEQLPEWLEGCKFNANTRMDVTWPPSKSFVMEVRGSEILNGSDFDIGATLRFPVAVRPLRTDKAWYDAMSERDIHEFLVRAEEQGGRLVSQAFSPSESGGEEKEEKDTLDGSRRPSASMQGEEEDKEDYDDDNEVDEAEGGKRRRMKVSKFSKFGERSHPFESHYPRLPLNSSGTSPVSPGRYSSFSPMSIIMPGGSSLATANSPSSYWRGTRGGGRSSHGAYEGDGAVVDVLKGRGIWVLSGDDRFPKASLDLLVVRLGGHLCQTLSPEVTYILAAEETFRTRALMSMLNSPHRYDMGKTRGPSHRGGGIKRPTHSENRKGRQKGVTAKHTSDETHLSLSPSSSSALSPSYLSSSYTPPPILHFRWLLECAQFGKVIPLRPDLVIHGTKETNEYFSEHFDSFGDSWFEEQNDISRKEVLQKFRNLLLHAQEKSSMQGRSSPFSRQRGRREEGDTYLPDGLKDSGISGRYRSPLSRTQKVLFANEEEDDHTSMMKKKRNFPRQDLTLVSGQRSGVADAKEIGDPEIQRDGERELFISDEMARWVLRQHVLQETRATAEHVQQDGNGKGDTDNERKEDGDCHDKEAVSLKCMRLFVFSEDWLWQSKVLKPLMSTRRSLSESVDSAVSPSFSSSESSVPSSPCECRLSTSSSAPRCSTSSSSFDDHCLSLIRSLTKAHREATIARCYLRGMRQVQSLTMATHALIPWNPATEE
ncbi:atp-dependent dna ligase domain-containing protein, partial [Cystoisospora suis]